MSIFSNIGKAVKKGVSDVGHFTGDALNNKYVKGALAAGLAATGVGAPAAMAIMAGTGALGGTLRHGGGLKGALTGAGQGALTGGAAAMGGSAVKKLGSMAMGQMAGRGGSAGGNVPSESDPYGDGNPTSFEPSGSGGIMDKIGGVVKGAAGAIGGNGKGGVDWGKLGKLGLAGAGLYGQHQATNKANQYFDQQQSMRNDLMGQAKSDYAARAPLRDQSFSKLSSLMQRGPSGDVYRPFLNKEKANSGV